MTDDNDPAAPKSISLKARLARGGILVAPGVYDALTASLASAAGFEALFRRHQVRYSPIAEEILEVLRSGRAPALAG